MTPEFISLIDWIMAALAIVAAWLLWSMREDKRKDERRNELHIRRAYLAFKPLIDKRDNFEIEDDALIAEFINQTIEKSWGIKDMSELIQKWESDK